MKNPKVLLLVEHEPLILSVLSEALSDAGYLPIECESSAEAIIQMEAHPDAGGMITDIRLGNGPSGWEIARLARSHNPEMAVVYVSGDSGADWPVEGVSDSMMIPKPFTYRAVVAAISKLLRPVGQGD